MRASWMLIAALSLTGCAAYGIRDRTSEQTALTNACYVVKRPSFLYEARCADLAAGGLGGATYCTGIQAFDPPPYVRSSGEQYDYHYPKSWSDYSSDKPKWDKQLFDKALFGKQRTALSPVDVGTQLRISGVYEYPRGETGHVLIVRAQLTSGQYKGTIVELKTPGGFSDGGPAWIESYFYSAEEDIRVSETYLKPCEVETD